MNVRIFAAGSGKNVVIGVGEGDLLADVDMGTVDVGDRGSIHETVDKRRVRIQINLLDAAGELVGRLGQL
jgi:hypothetical protein